MKYKKIFLSTEFLNEKTAKTKAKVDVIEVLEKAGYHSVYFPKVKSMGEVLRFWKELSGLIAKGGHLVLEYPCYPRKRMWLIWAFKKIKGLKLYGVIHDIGDLRFTDEEHKDGNDMHFLKLYDGLVSHNASMTRWLREKGFKKPIVDLHVFDYCLAQETNFNEPALNGKFKVVYAGNLAFNKATYIYDKNISKLQHIELGVYGPYFEKERINGSALSYKGMFDPQSPDLKEKYHFGLIWEGESTETCSGQMGRYIRFNNPHKFSLYISLGLPVFVWKEAAIAPFVLQNGIGTTIESFDDLEKLDQRITEKDYQEYLVNIKSLSEKVRNGYFLNQAVNQLVKS
jgi:hypothetical protein